MSLPPDRPEPPEDISGPLEPAAPPDLSGPPGSAPAAPTGDEPPRRTVARGTAGVLTVLALSVPFGLGWNTLAPDVPVWVVEGGIVYADSQPEQLMAADGWFLLLGLPVGVAAAVLMWLVARPLRGVPGLVLLSLASIGAGLLAWWLGRQIGLADYQDLLAVAEVGTRLSRPPDLRAAQLSGWPPRATGVVLAPALTAAITYTLLAAWSRFPELRG